MNADVFYYTSYHVWLHLTRFNICFTNSILFLRVYSASRWCRYILRFFDQSNTLAASPLYKAKGAFFLHELLIACTERLCG